MSKNIYTTKQISSCKPDRKGIIIQKLDVINDYNIYTGGAVKNGGKVQVYPKPV